MSTFLSIFMLIWLFSIPAGISGLIIYSLVNGRLDTDDEGTALVCICLWPLVVPLVTTYFIYEFYEKHTTESVRKYVLIGLALSVFFVSVCAMIYSIASISLPQ